VAEHKRPSSTYDILDESDHDIQIEFQQQQPEQNSQLANEQNFDLGGDDEDKPPQQQNRMTNAMRDERESTNEMRAEREAADNAATPDEEYEKPQTGYQQSHEIDLGEVHPQVIHGTDSGRDESDSGINIGNYEDTNFKSH